MQVRRGPATVRGIVPVAMPLSRVAGWEGAGIDEPKPGDLPVIRQSHCSTRDREVVFCLHEFRAKDTPVPGRAGVF